LTELSIDATGLVFRAYADRLAALRSRGDLAYGVVFKNVGASAGASLEHVHSQVLATALVPPPIAHRLIQWRRAFDQSSASVVLQFINQELEDSLRIVSQTERFAAVCPFASRVPFEIRIVPLAPRPYFEDSSTTELDEVARLVHVVLARLEQITARMAYNLIIHTAPFDTAPHDYYHWHIEILPRLTRAAGFEWGTGCFINPLAPEDAARRLRDDTREARAHDECEPHAEPADRAARDRLEQDVGPARQKEGREEVPVEPALVRQKGHADERAAEERDRNLNSPARGRVLGGTVGMTGAHRRSGR
jgi:UDPglucose--hexose-1-phosphate uridylyltransferase